MTEQLSTNQETRPGGKNRFQTVLDLLRLREESEKTVLICGEETLSYRQLASDAKQIAGCLLAQGLRKGDRVLLSVRNSIHVVRAMFAVMLAGGVYVAADAAWPAERLRLVSEEAGVSVTLTDEMIAGYLRADCSPTRLPTVGEADEAAVYYTSGSMGTPKGTVLYHRILVSYARSADVLPEFYERDRFWTVPVFASIFPAVAVFMLPVYEKTLVLTTPGEMASVEKLVDCLVRNRVQSLGATPSFLLRALAHPLFARVVRQQVTHLWVGGELLKESDARKLYASMENGVLASGYGSTETYLFSMARYEPGKELCLERFPEGVRLYVLNEEMKPVSAGEAGEILVGGISAQYGRYLDPELNRKKYVEHPVYGRLFRIGDAGRLLSNGEIKVVGRIDRMVKLHGLRIEPGEVEAAIEAFDGIRRAAVVLKNEQLRAYYMAEGEAEESSLRLFLSKRLPYFMIPAVIVRLEAFPLNENGKLDYIALPEPEKDAGRNSAPVNEREGLLCRIFGEVLKAEEPVGAEDSFFSLGGDSIHALTVACLLEKEGYSIDLKDVFIAPTPRLLAPLLRAVTEAPEWEETAVSEDTLAALRKELDLEDVEAVYPASAVAESYLKDNRNTWPQVYCFAIGADVSPEALEAAVEEAGRNHTALRSLILPAGNGHFCQVVLKTPRSRFFRTDLSALSEGEGLSQKQKEYLSTLLRMEYSSMTDLGKKTLLRVGHIRLSRDRALLYIGSSHLTMEVLSVDRLFRELTGRAESRPDADALRRHMGRLLHADRGEANAYWEKLLNGCDAYTALPGPPVSPENGKKEIVYASCGPLLYEKARSFCSAHQVTLSALLAYCLGRSLQEVLCLNEVCFPVAGSGRNASEMELPGMFVVLFPLRLTKEDTVFTCQNQLLKSGEHLWVWADPAVSARVSVGRTPVLRTAHGDNAAEEQQLRLYSELFASRQLGEALGGYRVSGGAAVGVRAETDRELSWNIMFDSGCHDPAVIRRLSAEWIRQIKECIGENT